MDRGVWWAAVHGVTESRTWLKHKSDKDITGKGDYRLTFFMSIDIKIFNKMNVATYIKNFTP